MMNKFLSDLARKRSELCKKIAEKIAEERGTELDTNEDEEVLKSYMELIPRMTKKREKNVIEENKVVKKVKAEVSPCCKRECANTGKLCARRLDMMENVEMSPFSESKDESANNARSSCVKSISSSMREAENGLDSDSVLYTYNIQLPNSGSSSSFRQDEERIVHNKCPRPFVTNTAYN